MNNPDIKLATSRGVSPDYGSGNGSGRDNLLERVASLEMEIKHLATKTWILACVLFVTFSVVSTGVAGVWYLSGRLATIESKFVAVEASFDSYKESHNREHDREYSR